MIDDIPAEPAHRRGAGPGWGQDDRWEIEAGVVRPYLFTRGRTRAGDDPIALETMVSTTPEGHGAKGGLPAERRNIIDLCTRPQSIAEVSAKLRTPLGVTRVLVADLADDHLLRVDEGTDDLITDVRLLERLIARVKAIPV